MPSQKLSERLTVRLSWDEYQSVLTASARHGLLPSAILRLALRQMISPTLQQ